MSSYFIPSAIRQKSSGFTLMEMMITLAIFLLLSAAVFGIITGVLHSASALQDNQNRRDQLVALNDYLNRQLRGLPANGTLISYRRGDGEGLNQNGIIFGQGERLTALDATKQDNGYYTLRLTTLDPSTLPQFTAAPVLVFEVEVIKNNSNVIWTPLIHDLKQIAWKFQILNMTEWLEMWSDAVNKPNLVELTLEQAGDLQPAVMDFWVPHIAPIALTLPPPSTGATPAPTSAPVNH